MMRVLALLIAVGMVVGAFVLRGTLSLPWAAGEAAADGSTPRTRVLCDAELAPACDALSQAGHSVTTQHAGASYADLIAVATPDAAPDVWVTIAPWPAMVDEARTRAGLGTLFDPTPELVAASPLVLAMWEERAAALESSCHDPYVDIGCVAAAAGSTWEDLGGAPTWGTVKPGISRPSRSSTGLAWLAALTADRLGTDTFGTTRLQAGDYLDWLRVFAAAVPSFDPSAGSALDAMMQAGPASFDVAFTTEAAVLEAKERDARYVEDLRLVYAEPTRTADVVAVRRSGNIESVMSVTVDALAAAHWHTATGSPETPAVSLDRTAGDSLPASGAQTALRASFSDTVRG